MDIILKVISSSLSQDLRNRAAAFVQPRKEGKLHGEVHTVLQYTKNDHQMNYGKRGKIRH